jgi:hypothetical protein
MGLHSSTFQLNLSRFCHKIHPRHPLMSPDTPYTPLRQPLNVPPIPQKALELSRKVNECKPLHAGTWQCCSGHVRTAVLGEAVQVAPMKLNFKPPRSEHLKLKCDAPLSNLAFIFNLRRYTVEEASV